MKYITSFLIIVATLSIKNVTAQEKWYKLVDIGVHYWHDSGLVKQEMLNSKQGEKIFEKNLTTLIKETFYKEIESLRKSWLEKNDVEYRKKMQSDKNFRVDTTHTISTNITDFSKTKVKVNITFNYGHSRWHHYYVILKDYIIERNDMLDDIFYNLKEAEKQYSFTYNDIGHGTSVMEMENKLGRKYLEYNGQSPQFRNIYYPKHNIKIIIQNGIIKYIETGKPEWMYSKDNYRENN